MMVSWFLTNNSLIYTCNAIAILLAGGNNLHGLSCKNNFCSPNDNNKGKVGGLNEASLLVSGPTKSNISYDGGVSCKIGINTRAMSLQCFYNSRPQDCKNPLSSGTLVTFSCPKFYKAKSAVVMCKENGQWSEPIKCVPECGVIKSPVALPLLMYGQAVGSVGQWPWAAALYFYNTSSALWVYKCGGTLITDNFVLTAAHCLMESLPQRDLNSTYFSIRLGTLRQEFNESDGNVYKVKRIYLLPVYQGETNGHNSDIAIIVLNKIARLTENILPACLPSPTTVVSPCSRGVVAGWGLDEYLNPVGNLKYIEVPIVDTKHCASEIQNGFQKYLSFTTFCAGYRNGTGVCNGDSGSGLLVHDKATNRWIVQGIVSLSPAFYKKHSVRCHPRSYALYTKIRMFIEWILTAIYFENRNFSQEDEVNSAIA